MGEIEAEDPKAVEAGPQGRRQGPRQGQPAGAGEAHRRRSTASCASVSEPPLLVPVEELLADGRDAATSSEVLLRRPRRPTATRLPGDRQHLLDGYRFRHIARKVVGVGSVGTRAWVVLLTGADDGDPLFLQAKEAEASVLEPYAGASRFENHGQRVVEGQRLMQAASDIFLGWCPAVGLRRRASATSTCASSGTGSARSRSSG